MYKNYTVDGIVLLPSYIYLLHIKLGSLHVLICAYFDLNHVQHCADLPK